MEKFVAVLLSEKGPLLSKKGKHEGKREQNRHLDKMSVFLTPSLISFTEIKVITNETTYKHFYLFPIW